MKISKEKFVSGATKWIGTREGDSNHKAILSIYNGAVPLPRGYRVRETDAWCATFVSSVAVETGCGDIFPRECSCWYMEKLAGQMGYIIDRDKANVGDVVLYDWEQDGTSDHVGIVVQRNGNTLKVVEGNMNNSVGYRNVGVQSKNIRTVFRMPFADSGSGGCNSGGCNHSCPEHCGVDNDKESIDRIARAVIRGEYGNGKERRNRVIAAGYDYSKVQQRVNEILRTGK